MADPNTKDIFERLVKVEQRLCAVEVVVLDAKKVSSENSVILQQIEGGRKLLFWIFAAFGWFTSLALFLWDKVFKAN